MAMLCSLGGGPGAAAEEQVSCVMSEGKGCSACVERAAIRDKINQLEEEIIKLKTKYHMLGTMTNATHDPFIHKLPAEIGSHIFRLCLPALDPTGYAHYAQKLLLQVLGLGAVCQKWRQLAWATPNLWHILSITISPKRVRTRGSSWPGLIKEWLGRSGGLPLTISFLHDQDSPNPEEFDSALEGIIDVLALYSSRWQNLYLEVYPTTLRRFSRSMHLGQLLRLELVGFGPGRFSAQKVIMKSKPFPTYLRLEDVSPTSIDIGWNNITEVNLSYLTTNECAEVLRRAPALEHFHAEEFLYLGRPTANVNAFIIHRRIRSLDLPAEANDFLNMINVPSLEEWTQAWRGTSLVTAMVSFLERSSCCLKILNLQRLRIGSSKLLTVFQATPFLERLEMHFMRRNNAVDDILVRIFQSPPDQHPFFLPCLQFMECRTSSKTAAPFSWDRIPDLYRLGHRRSLTLKSVINAFETSNETAMELSKLVDEGAKFLISDSIEGGDFLENFKKRISREDVEIRKNVNATSV